MFFLSDKVISTSWIEGTKLKSREVLLENGLDPTSIIRTAVISGIQQLLEFCSLNINMKFNYNYYSNFAQNLLNLNF